MLTLLNKLSAPVDGIGCNFPPLHIHCSLVGGLNDKSLVIAVLASKGDKISWGGFQIKIFMVRGKKKKMTVNTHILIGLGTLFINLT
jgi:hypothetical protein